MFSTISFFLAVLFSPLLALPQPRPPASEGETCLIGGFAPLPCASNLTCVLSDFGNPPIDAPRVGRCQSLLTEPPLCTVILCSSTGADTICRAPTLGSLPSLVATCRAWATRQDIGGLGPVCPRICRLVARVPPLVASDGSTYSNLCFLRAASCASNFEIFGPVEAICAEPISPLNAATCCIERGIGCLGRGQRCSTLGSRVRPVPCEPGLTCVIRNFGFPAADRPNEGLCRRVTRRVPDCTVRRCSRVGPRRRCRVLEPQNSGIISTCKAWAGRSDGNPGPDCGFACPENCLIGDLRPKASNGTVVLQCRNATWKSLQDCYRGHECLSIYTWRALKGSVV